MKLCKTCGVEKQEELFPKGYKKKDGSYGLRASCKECTVKHNLDLYHNRGGKQKQKQRSFKNNLKKYNITPEDYQLLLYKQDGKCAICKSDKSHRSNISYNLFVDHCHTTGKVRGLLCHHCNAGIGYLNDDVERLQSAIRYLNENSTGYRDQPTT